ncbi:putative f-box domain protein [Diaporthe ampelina]|uniref:Putative f-box domain protein n=1 Tax=Diaporthe ampelina TaxID=1214573 RepID=A0A0G2F3D9_9PEZI|nr:putative f-box domain protein [Diaporthe ampelina]
MARPGLTSLADLPSELIHHILSYLSPSDLVSISLTSHVLRAHSLADHLWQNLVQSNVPGIKLTNPSPCTSFRELYIAHDPRWFLTKYKVWFCDRDLTGKLVVIRYDERRGVIEGYQLLANRPIASTSTSHQSLSEQELVIHEFEPELKLHLDKPVLQIRANSLENAIRSTTGRSPAPSVKIRSSNVPWPSRLSSAADHASTSTGTPVHVNRFSAETPMPLDNRFTDTMFNTFILARSLPETLANERQLLPFPYGNTWPPPAIPADTRVSAGDLIGPEDRPTTSQPWKGIWVGDYSAHGCEFLLITQSHPTPFDEAAFDATRTEDESAANFGQRKMDARRYRGRLEAIKLTGDPNVPRGECTFVAEDLGEQGFVTTVDEEPFRGARVVRSKGHVAQTGFVNGKSAKLSHDG